MTVAEVLARALYDAGPLIPGRLVPTTAWRDLPAGAQRQWLEAGEYLAHRLLTAGVIAPERTP